MQKVLKLDLTDMVPQEASFELSGAPGKKLVLIPYTLRVQIWAEKKYGKKQIEAAIIGSDVATFSELVFYMLKDKAAFPKIDDLLDAVITFKDRANVTNALLESIGLSQPVLEKLTKQLEAQQAEGNEQSPSQTTGANSTTQLQVSTGIPASNS